jgi:lambda family phage portal protein
VKKRKYKNSGYSGGGASMEKNTLKEWFPKSYSPKSDLDMNLYLLRDRSADLATNSPLGAAAINTEITGVLGSGLRVFPKIKFRELGMTAEAARQWARKTKLEFEMWCNSLDCDYLRRNNFYELQRIAFQSYLSDGDSFCIFKRRFTTGNPYTLRLQVLPAQRISNPQNVGTFGLSPVEMQLPNGNKVVNGIEVDKSGRMVAIWVSNRIWDEPQTTTAELKWQRVRIFGKETGCRNVLHICYDTRAEMFRGAPFLSPVIETLKQVSRYSDAELTAVIIKSFFSIFFVQPLSNFEFSDILPEEEQKLPVNVQEYKLGSGTISALPRGVDVKAISRNDSQSNFDSFVSHFVKQIASALNLPYELIIKQFQSSYSASKAALIEAEKEFRQRRAAFVNDFLQPVYENFLIEAVATGRISAPGFFDDPVKRYCWCSADWRNEQNHNLDEIKETQGAIMRINAGLSTRAMEVAALNGTDFYENIEQLEMENALMKKVFPQVAGEQVENDKTRRLSETDEDAAE